MKAKAMIDEWMKIIDLETNKQSGIIQKIYNFRSGQKVKIAPVGEARLITEKERSWPSWANVLNYEDCKTCLLLWSENSPLPLTVKNITKQLTI